MTSSAIDIMTVIAEQTRGSRVRFADANNMTVQPKRGKRGAREKQDPYERFMAKVQKGADPDDCWIWLGGSCRFHLSGRGKGAAVEFRLFAWEQVYGKAPEGKLFAQCRNAKCCNPAHLAPKHPGFIERSKVMQVDARKRVVAPMPADVRPASTTPSAALRDIMAILDSLESGDRERVLGAALVFYNVGTP